MVLGLCSRTKVGAKGSTALASLKLLGGIAALFDGLGEIALIFCVQKGNFADFVEVETDCVRHVNLDLFLRGWGVAKTRIKG